MRKPRVPNIVLKAVPWQSADNAEMIVRWDALADWASEPNPFYECWYLLPALRALDPGGSVELLMLEADGELAGILPVQKSWRYYGKRLPHCRNWVHANCFLGMPLVARNFEKTFWRTLFAWADEHWNRAMFLHLSHLPLDGKLYRAFKDVVAETPARTAALVHEEARALLKGGASSSDYLEAALNGKKRKELRRQSKRLAELGTVEFRKEAGTHGLKNWTAEFLALEQTGWKGEAGSALACDPATSGMFTDALEFGVSRRRIERLSLELDGEAIAMLVNFVCGDSSFSYKTAFAEDYARFSPGVLLQLENLKQLDRAGFAWSDSCASEDHPMIDRLWRDKRLIGRINIGLGGPLRRPLFKGLTKLELRRKNGQLP